MPDKKRYAEGHRGAWAKRPDPERRRGPSLLTECLPGHRGRSHSGPEAPADWGSDGQHDGSSGDINPGRNGGMRFFREIDMSDREERVARGVKALKYTWRTIVGPTPELKRGDRLAAKEYLRRLEDAIDKGGWTTSEAAGLYLARKVWQARAQGEDPRYDEVGNRKGGLTKQESSAVEMRRIMLDMRKALENSARGEGFE